MPSLRSEDPDAPAPGSLSIAWRCVSCGAYHLQSAPVPQPASCGHCGGLALAAAGPRATGLPDGDAGDPANE